MKLIIQIAAGIVLAQLLLQIGNSADFVATLKVALPIFLFFLLVWLAFALIGWLRKRSSDIPRDAAPFLHAAVMSGRIVNLHLAVDGEWKARPFKIIGFDDREVRVTDPATKEISAHHWRRVDGEALIKELAP